MLKYQLKRGGKQMGYLGCLRNSRCQKQVNSFRKFIATNMEDENRVLTALNNLYSYMKKIAPAYSENGKMNKDYRELVCLLYLIEASLPLSFIVDNKPNFNMQNKAPFILPNKAFNYKNEDVLAYIVYIARENIVRHFSSQNNLKDLSKIDLLNYCSVASFDVKSIAESLGLSAKVYPIYPAFYKEKNLYEYGNMHYFTFVSIGKKLYIVDLTYSQFFKVSDNNLNRIGIPFLGGSSIGSYMLLFEERKKFAEALLRDGYVEATEENIKMYFDGFALSFRNGLYYENTCELKYETSYTMEDYMNFINGLDSQINHENIEFLGRQQRLLKNANMNFQKR